MRKILFFIGGVVAISILGVILFAFSNDQPSKTDFNYDIEYDDLVTRKVWAVSVPASEIIPERNCHKFNAEEMSSLPQGLKYVMDESTRDIPFYDAQDGFYDGFTHPIKFDDAIKLLEKYDFNLTKKTEYDALNKINDTTYHFECIFEDDKFQYKLGFNFDSHYSKNERLVFVNITKNNQGIPIIENQHVKLFSGGFNGTVVFNNKLDDAITIHVTNPQPDEYWDENIMINEITIPAGKVWSVSPRSWWYPYDNVTYQYTIMPENLQGTFTLMRYPSCMTENEVKSLYSQVEVYPHFPSYLPDGYYFECGVHNMNSYVHFVYFTDDLHQKFEDKVNAVSDREFFASGGIRVDHYSNIVTSNFIENYDYDKYKKANEKAQHPWAKTLTIAGDPAVMIQEYFWKDGEQFSFNRLQIFSDEITHSVRSGLPESELIKIAESLFHEPET